jgi:hypothetical protein
VPTWTPNWEDVRFNASAATHYSDLCRRTALLLEQLMQRRSVAAATTSYGWEGPNRNQFDDRLLEEQQLAGRLVTRLLEAANSAAAAQHAAVTLQQAREADRQRWHAEAALEQEQERRREEQRQLSQDPT